MQGGYDTTPTLLRTELETRVKALPSHNFVCWLVTISITGLHSNRMHTSCLLPVSPSMHCTGGAWSQGVSAPRGVPGPGVRGGWCLPLVPGVSALGVPCPGGVPASGPKGGVSQHAMGQTPCEQNHRHV